VDRTGSGLSQMVCFGTNSVESLGSITGELVN
jgi:hypothetical protein